MDKLPGSVRSAVYLPPQYAISATIHGNSVRQLFRSGRECDVTVGSYSTDQIDGLLLTDSDGLSTLVVARDHLPGALVDSVLVLPRPRKILDPRARDEVTRNARWIRPTQGAGGEITPGFLEELSAAAHHSWRGAFAFIGEERADGVVLRPGLRPPQLGAVHAALAHWATSDETATIVMPTGTGKTETMLALLVSAGIRNLLVIVPSDALRTQIAGKFESLGLLKQFGVVGPRAAYPVVATLSHTPKSPGEVDDIFRCANVVVMTAQIAGGCTQEVQERMADRSTHLFIDEAHHVRANTWELFRKRFERRRVLQFTATPFRRDRRLVDGTRIFNYPLRKAQQEGYFKKIQFRAVTEFSTESSDAAVARLAVEQLEADLAAGLDHLVMARTDYVKRADVVHQIYTQLAGHHKPVIVYNGISQRAKREALRALLARESRIVVCVDMLGEGFDLPNLKIAALHDMHRSLAVTLQFTGRFTRTSENIGDATVIANIADERVGEAVRDLYEESADWNYLLRRLSEGAIRRHKARTDFIEAFGELPPELPIQSVFPKMSAVVYATRCAQWTPDQAEVVPAKGELYAGPAINHSVRVVVYVTRETEPVTWGPQQHPINVTWHLYLAFWDETRNLLFINSSNNDSHHEKLARAVCGSDVELIGGEKVFRSLHGVNRLALTNMGVKHALNRANRFTMYVGSDVIQGLEQASLQNRAVTNVFGLGYSQGARATIGCSVRGRVWSYQVAEDITEWVEWCRAVGGKLADDAISTSSIIKAVMRPEQIADRPRVAPIVIEWPDEFFVRNYDAMKIELDGNSTPFFDADIELLEHSEEGPIKFKVQAGSRSAEYEMRFGSQGVDYVLLSPSSAVIVQTAKRVRLEEWFSREPPTVRFADGSYLEGNWLLRPTHERLTFDRQRISPWDWHGTDLSKESQTTEKLQDSIQYRVISEAKQGKFGYQYDVIIDDDGKGEIADVVAVAITNDERIIFDLFHCKYSQSASPGARVGDLYEVCGQAQKSVVWKSRIDRMLLRLGKRDQQRTSQTGVSRFEVGAPGKLLELRKMSRYLTAEFRVFIVQPGLSQTQATEQQLELLAVTALYLKETFAVSLCVIANE